MTRLELVQELVMLAGFAASGPSTTLSQVGGYGKAVRYIDMAHEEIQSMYSDWDFLWAEDTITTVSGTAAYAGAADLGVWDTRTLYYDNEPLAVIDWKDYVAGSGSTGEPEQCIVRPDNKLLLVPTPDDAYTITYNYYRTPLKLAADDDEPLIPARFQRVIIGRALILFGNFEVAEEAKIQGQEIYQVYMRNLKDHQLSRRRNTAGLYESNEITVVVE